MAVTHFLDANIVLRYLLQDEPKLYAEARRWIEESDNGSLLLTPVIVAEIVYILFQKDYSRRQIAETLQFVLSIPAIEAEDRLTVSAALQLFAERSLDFADCYILERSIGGGVGLATQDKKLQNTRKGRR